MTEKRPRGRPVTFNRAIADEIIKRLSAGESLRSICREDRMPPESTVREWVADNRDNFAAQYTRAREIQMDSLAEDILEIADGNDGDVMRARLRVDTRKWLMSKIAPKRFGDKVAIGGDSAMDPIRMVDLSGLTVDQLRNLESALGPLAIAAGTGVEGDPSGDQET